jgi:hypothetical protein
MRHGPMAGKIAKMRNTSQNITRSPGIAIQTIILAIGRKQSTATLKKIITVMEFIIESSITIARVTTDILGKVHNTDTITGTGPIIKSTMMIIDRL